MYRRIRKYINRQKSVLLLSMILDIYEGDIILVIIESLDSRALSIFT